ncbi:leucine-responsive transcriptional regulator Lrp [Glaciecola sp. XM2]|jgi:Lrp/AsnC family leucine-responsive transcriptional regulator|uniref:leucine-responsive transcriptional regulator Lrp n=1 Tax=Glaciecola sp. XM2 TaxID=1914931 RepID=UPI001BDE1947|nr:leucine-responsive transcriptional regulator Lrp [Glaciecola sp. XM2]MBT1449610.1 leucine-responsive transcriptional regulator Lrp [Glaciecola sp. XM2]
MLVKTPKHIDRIDRRILNELQSNGKISNVDLAKLVGLSASPCLERVKRLESQGYIDGYYARLNPDMLGAAMLVFVEITLTKTSVDIFAEFSAAVQQHEDIQECHLVSGNFDFLLKARVADMSSYRKLLGDTLLRLPGVSESRTYVVMEEVKHTSKIKINLK